jgi:hypothetical protein
MGEDWVAKNAKLRGQLELAILEQPHLEYQSYQIALALPTISDREEMLRAVHDVLTRRLAVFNAKPIDKA